MTRRQVSGFVGEGDGDRPRQSAAGRLPDDPDLRDMFWAGFTFGAALGILPAAVLIGLLLRVWT